MWGQPGVWPGLAWGLRGGRLPGPLIPTVCTRTMFGLSFSKWELGGWVVGTPNPMAPLSLRDPDFLFLQVLD